MSSQNDSDTQNETEHDPGEFYGVRDGTLFLIDASPEMFNNDDNTKPPFVEYIEEYIYILKQKLVWNRQDWMGLVLFGTEKWDTDPEIKNILTLQKFSLININKLKEAEKIRDATWRNYKRISSSKSYPLHDVLWHAAQIFSSIKLTMSARRVILYTCHDVPPLTDENEKHRIRAKAATYNDIGLKLYVVGPETKWNFELFYKDLEMLSRNISKEDYQRVSYKNLVQQVKRPARNMAKLPFRIGKDVTINVNIFNVCATTEDLKKMKMSSETNAPLVSFSHFRRQDADDEMEDDGEEEGEDEEKIVMPIAESDLRKVQEFGGEKIYFTVDEVKSLNSIYEMGIDIVEAKPLSCDPMYHLHSPYFITCNKNCTKGEKLLFAGLLNKCEQRNLMLTCRAIFRTNSGAFLYNMLPVSTEGGFYLYKIPYEENVYDFPSDADQYAYNNEDKKPPINDEAVELFKKIIKRTLTDYDPETFPNPKLQVKLQSLETLALDLDTQDPPPDETLPQLDILQERIGGLTKKIKDIFMLEGSEFDPPSNKKSKRSGKGSNSGVPDSDKDILELVEQKQLNRLKVADLQIFLRDAGLKASGRKEELISRLYEYYSNDKVKDENV